ncbi:LysR family transcriptional regulator [Neptuniibacter caesariensis]|uniref:LysR protein n=1 Tax=Neptuniibacter caesariensis TaxID=207954 RepID=A0A7U8C2U3_NEPCE|nr:LysR family transcriptional regulator [Neptuniibacter caesariensis]EAR60194.1 LysR protein [Oceanospirillum sp. MED92] [Neptuniibacter caesariensis]
MKGATFNQLTIFHAIVQEGSIRGAARKLEIAPPSVSQALKQLENHLGLPLFTRSTRSIELTEAGEQLHEETRSALSTLDFALESVQDLSEKASGRVSITLPHFVFEIFLKPIYAEFCDLYPDIQLEISLTDKTVNILDEGIDLGIRFGERLEAGMVARQLTPDLEAALFASPEYVAKYGVPKQPEDLQHHRLIRYRFSASNQLAPLLLEHKGEVLNIEMPSSIIVNDTNAMTDAASKGLGIGCLVTPIVSEQFKRGELVPLMKDYWHPFSGLYLFFVQNSQKARRVRVLVDFLLEKAKQLEYN